MLRGLSNDSFKKSFSITGDDTTIRKCTLEKLFLKYICMHHVHDVRYLKKNKNKNKNYTI